MKSKTLIILAVVCAVLAGAAYLTTQKKQKETKSELGKKVFESLQINEVTSVTIQSPEDKAVIKKGDKVWEVENRYRYPANFSKVADTLKKIRDIKVGRSFPSDDGSLERLGLHLPDAADKPADQKGTRIILENKDKKIVADIIFGKEREASAGGGGQYFKSASDSSIYMTDSSFRYMEKKPSDWMDKELFKIKPEDIEQVICMNPVDQSVVYKLKRPGKGESPEFMDLPKDRTPDRSKINSLFGAIAAFQIDDVADPANDAIRKEFEGMKYVEFHLFNGTVYKLYPGKPVETDPEKYYLRAEAAYIRPEPPSKAPETTPQSTEETTSQKQVVIPVENEVKDQKTGSDAQTNPEPPKETLDYDKLTKEAEEVNLKVSSWVYVIPKWRIDNLKVEGEELLEKVEKPEEKKDEGKKGK